MPEADSDRRDARASAVASPTPSASDGRSRTSRPILEAAGCYERRDAAVREVVPEYGDGLALQDRAPAVSTASGCGIFSVVARSPDGEPSDGAAAAERVPRDRRRHELQAAHAQDARVLPRRPAQLRGRRARRTGSSTTRASSSRTATAPPTSSRSRTSTRRQVYALAEHLGVPEEIRAAPPTTDTYSLPQTQEEFYFSLPHDQMDLCLYARDHGSRRTPWPSRRAHPEQVERVFATSTRSGAPRAICTSRRSSSRRSRRSSARRSRRRGARGARRTPRCSSQV